MRTKNKEKELNHRHFIGLRLTDGVTPYGTMNTTGVKGSAQELGMQGIYKNPANPSSD